MKAWSPLSKAPLANSHPVRLLCCSSSCTAAIEAGRRRWVGGGSGSALLRRHKHKGRGICVTCSQARALYLLNSSLKVHIVDAVLGDHIHRGKAVARLARWLVPLVYRAKRAGQRELHFRIHDLLAEKQTRAPGDRRYSPT
jgi:hypothetical protein